MLSHIPAYRSDEVFNEKIMRWEPESIVALPQGIGVLDFMVPGSDELMSNNVASLRKHMIVLWSKHGVMARSDVSVTNAVDKIEYAETGAKYEYMNLAIGGIGEGLRREELVAVKDAFSVNTDLV
jgi:rhamnulose-1-phosphate aldolase